MSDWPKWAVPGAIAICIDAKAPEGTAWMPGSSPVEGRAYTISATFLDTNGTPCAEFVDLRRNPRSPFRGYGLFRFRPAVEDKSDNEIEARLYQKRMKSQVISPKPEKVE